MDPASLLYLAAGGSALLAALLPRLLDRRPVSMPMAFLGLGVLVFAVFDGLPSPDPLAHGPLTEHVTELCVVISLLGAGLALDRPVGWRRWMTTWRLLGIGMLLTIAGIGLLGGWLLGLGAAAALLLAGALAPTDPVLAGDVQVGEPADDADAQEDEPRFALTSEAGLNDGLAFPAVGAAVAISLVGVAPEGWLGEWVLLDLLWKIGVGVGMGVLVGWLLGRIFFRERLLVTGQRTPLAEEMEGFVALACVFLAYGATQAVHGYGFIAVFVCACVIRSAERNHGYHGVLHGFIEQIERLLTAGILLLLGGAMARGLLAGVGVREVVFAVLVLLLVRPLAGWLALAGSGVGPRDRAVIAFFGVRGVGSIYYLAYALENGAFEPVARELWAVLALVVAGSVVIHGVSATPVMQRLDRVRYVARRRRAPDAPDGAVTV